MFGINFDPWIDASPLPVPRADTHSDETPCSPITPRWFGPPVEGEACSFTGLERATFQTKLLGAFGGSVVKVSLIQKGAHRGKHLVFAPSVHEMFTWLSAHPGKIPEFKPDFRGARLANIPRRWIRAPKNQETCSFTSLGHYSFYSLLEEAGSAIQTAQLRLPDESRASRLVWLPSIHDYLVRKAEKQYAE